MPIPQQAIAFIVDQEIGGEAYYQKFAEHLSYPGGASGPTIGVGYDLGEVTVAQARADWEGILPVPAIEAICAACGLRGAAAQAWVEEHGGEVTVTYAQAVTEFAERELPKWETNTAAALPNFAALPGLSQGALVSLTMNRGSGIYVDPGARYAEGRTIKQLMESKFYMPISIEIEAMKRLWPAGSDLYNRRIAEAALFKEGLSQA